MKEYAFHEISSAEAYGILSIMDYEAPVRLILDTITFPASDQDRKIVVDLALRNGLNRYRFLLLDLSKDGKIIWERNSYYSALADIEEQANSFLKEYPDYVANSVLSDKVAERLLEQTIPLK